MQEESTIGNGEYQPYESQALAASNNDTLYPFDADSLDLDIPHGENIVTITYRKPELQDYLNRQAAQYSKTKISGGAIVGAPINHMPDVEFFDAVITSAVKKSRGGRVLKEYDQTACMGMPFEFKVKCVKKMTTSKFTVEVEGDDLSDTLGSITVTQIIGDGPSYTITYQLGPLSEKQRSSYLNGADTKSSVKNGDRFIETEPHYIEKAMKIFGGDKNGKDAAFISLDGGRLQSGPFAPEKKQEFITHIDPLFQMGIVDAICEYYAGGLD